VQATIAINDTWLPVILALFLTCHSLYQNISHACLNHAFYPFVTFVESGTLLTIPLLKPSFQGRLYCNSIFLNFPRCQLDRLQLILNSAARAVSKTHRFSHISPILKSLHWLKIDQCIQYNVLSLTYKTLQSKKPAYLYNLLNLQARSSTVTSASASRIKIAD